VTSGGTAAAARGVRCGMWASVNGRLPDPGSSWLSPLFWLLGHLRYRLLFKTHPGGGVKGPHPQGGWFFPPREKNQFFSPGPNFFPGPKVAGGYPPGGSTLKRACFGIFRRMISVSVVFIVYYFWNFLIFLMGDAFGPLLCQLAPFGFCRSGYFTFVCLDALIFFTLLEYFISSVMVNSCHLQTFRATVFSNVSACALPQGWEAGRKANTSIFLIG